ncbi:MAG: hypothetical protein QNJ90_05980 [Planctomycetota bacterium]|nr:hypothetical protein [Planctomycetota bacterium]
MAVWKLQRLARKSALTGEPFPPDSEVVTALFGEEEEETEDRVKGSGFVRKDFLASEATDELLAGAWCTWRTRTAPAKDDGPKRFDLGMAREFLQRLLAEGREDRAAVCLTLALLLARKRRLIVTDQDADTLTARWPKEKDTFTVPAPQVSEAEAETLQQDLMRLFDMEVVESPAPNEAEESEAASEDEPAAD